MGVCLQRVEKKYYGEIIRNQILSNVLRTLENVSFARIDYLEEAGTLEFPALEFKEWYETTTSQLPKGMEELYKEVLNYIKENNITDECEYITFEWF